MMRRHITNVIRRACTLVCIVGNLFLSHPRILSAQASQGLDPPPKEDVSNPKSKALVKIAYEKHKLFIEACTPLIDEVNRYVKSLKRFEVVDQIKGDGSHLRIKCRGGTAKAEWLFYPKQFNTEGELPGIVVAKVSYKGRSIRKQVKSVVKILLTELLRKSPWQGEATDLVEIPYVAPSIQPDAEVAPEEKEIQDDNKGKIKKFYRVNLDVGSNSGIFDKPCQPLTFGTLAVDLPATNVLFAPLAEGVITKLDKTKSSAEVRFTGKQPRKEYSLFVQIPPIDKVTETMIPLIKECEKLLQPEDSIIPTWLEDKFGVDVYGVMEGVGFYVSWMKTDDDRVLSNIKTLVFENEIQLGKFLSLDLFGVIGFFGEDQSWEPRVVGVQNKAEMFTTSVTIGPRFPFGPVDVDFGIGTTADKFNNPFPGRVQENTEIDPDTGEETKTTTGSEVDYRKGVKIRPTFSLKLNLAADRWHFGLRNSFSNGSNGFHYANDFNMLYGLSRSWYIGAGFYNFKAGRDNRFAPGVRSTGAGILVEIRI